MAKVLALNTKSVMSDRLKFWPDGGDRPKVRETADWLHFWEDAVHLFVVSDSNVTYHWGVFMVSRVCVGFFFSGFLLTVQSLNCRRCECEHQWLFVSLCQPFDGLAAHPGWTPSFDQCQMGLTSAPHHLAKDINNGWNKWRVLHYTDGVNKVKVIPKLSDKCGMPFFRANTCYYV